jgi:hypothetical protein
MAEEDTDWSYSETVPVPNIPTLSEFLHNVQEFFSNLPAGTYQQNRSGRIRIRSFAKSEQEITRIV